MRIFCPSGSRWQGIVVHRDRYHMECSDSQHTDIDALVLHSHLHSSPFQVDMPGGKHMRHFLSIIDHWHLIGCRQLTAINGMVP